MFFLKYIWQEMHLQPGWYAGLFLTDGTLLYLFGLLLERILRNNDSFEILLHFVLLMPVLLLLTFAVLLPLYAQKQQNDLLYPEYRDLLSMELSRRQIRIFPVSADSGDPAPAPVSGQSISGYTDKTCPASLKQKVIPMEFSTG